jgi:small subunit ribosomal protein S20
MPKTKSTKKALRQSRKRKTKNVKRKKKIKDLLKKVSLLVSQNKREEAKKLLPKIYKELDKAVKINLIKENRARRKKSRTMKLVTKSR